jgi:hypothetical protein
MLATIKASCSKVYAASSVSRHTDLGVAWAAVSNSSPRFVSKPAMTQCSIKNQTLEAAQKASKEHRLVRVCHFQPQVFDLKQKTSKDIEMRKSQCSMAAVSKMINDGLQVGLCLRCTDFAAQNLKKT